MTLDLRCLDNLQVDKIVDAAKNGAIDVAKLYETYVHEIAVETGLTKQNLETIGIPLAIPHFLVLPQNLTRDYLNEIYPDGTRKHIGMLDSEEKFCILESLLHIASSQDPSVESVRAVLKAMPACYLLKSWMASKSGDPSKPHADVFMFLRGNEVAGRVYLWGHNGRLYIYLYFFVLEAMKILENHEVHPSIIKVVCALHSGHVETLVKDKWLATPNTAFLTELDAVLRNRLSLKAGKINVQWFMDYEDKLVVAGWPRAQRLVSAMLKWPDAYPDAQRLLRDIKNYGRPAIWIGEPHQELRGGKGRRGPYTRY